MKYFISVLTIALLTITAVAQTPSFFKNGARWVYIVYEGNVANQIHFEKYYQYRVVNDTIFDGKSYKLLGKTFKSIYTPTSSVSSYQCETYSLIRHDTILNKVFYKENIDDTTERVIYDFNMTIGDTILLNRLYSNYDYSPSNSILIDSIFNVKLFDDSVKVFRLIDPFVTFEIESFFIEGLGGYTGLLWHNQEYILLGESYFRSSISCFEIDTIKFSIGYQETNGKIISVYPISVPSCNFIDCLVGIDNQSLNSEINIYPNPSKNQLHLSIHDYNSVNLISLTDTFGKTLQTYHGYQETIPLSDLSNGIYFLQIHLANGKTHTRKIIKH